MSVQSRLRQAAEVALLRVGLCLVPLLPRRMVVGLSRGLGWVGWRTAKRLRGVVLANLDVAYGADLSPAEKRRIALGSFRTAALVVLDLFWFQMDTRRRLRRWLRFDASMAEFFAPGPCVAVTAHLGNWEVLGVGLAAAGYGCTSVVAPLGSPGVDRFLMRMRTGSGQKITFKKGAVRVLMKTLRAGGRVALVVDQNTLPRDGGRFVDFFGLPVPMSKTAVMLAERTGVPLRFLYCVADRHGRYTGYLRRVNASGGDRLQGMASVLEETVRLHPGQWLWMYKRWKYLRDGESREAYPFYARRSLRGTGEHGPARTRGAGGRVAERRGGAGVTSDGGKCV